MLSPTLTSTFAHWSALIGPYEPESLVDHHFVRAIFFEAREIFVLLVLRDHTEHLGEHIVLEIGDGRANVLDCLCRLRSPAPGDLVQSLFLFCRRPERLDRKRDTVRLRSRRCHTVPSSFAAWWFDANARGRVGPVQRGTGRTSREKGDRQYSDRSETTRCVHGVLIVLDWSSAPPSDQTGTASRVTATHR